MSTVINIGSHNSSEMDDVTKRLDKIEDKLRQIVSMLSKIMYNQEVASPSRESYIVSSLNKLNYMMETLYSGTLCQIADILIDTESTETSESSTETSDNKSDETPESSISDNKSDEIDGNVTE